LDLISPLAVNWIAPPSPPVLLEVSIEPKVILPAGFPKVVELKVVPPVVCGILELTEVTPALKITEGRVVKVTKSGSLSGIAPEVSGEVIRIPPV
jgi:hypothetical protein